MLNGKKGEKWGKQGKCYAGTGARKRADKQRKAEFANKEKKKLTHQ